MRARPNAHTSINGIAATSNADEADANGKDKPKFKRPPTASFKLPPPPKILITSPAFRNDNGPADSSKTSAGAPISEVKSNDHAIDYPTASVLSPVPAIPIPPPPLAESAAYQRTNRIQRQSESRPATANALAPPGCDDDTSMVKQKANSRDGYSNAYHLAKQYPLSSNYSQISHPYQPSSWYLNKRNTRRNRQLLKKVLGGLLALAMTMLVLWALQYLKSIEHKQKMHHVRYHHHDHRHHIHPMMGIIESPLGFSTQQKKGYRELEQERTASEHQQTEGGNGHELFSTFPVITLSNGRLLPYVGFGVSSRSVEHKQIPTIVSTLLQYASSETLGGGGIAMIDAVVHEEDTLELDGGIKLIKQEDEKMESSMEKTVVALVGRSINYFGKEHFKVSKGLIPGTSSGPSDNGASYDYENRLEVHVLLGLSSTDIGAENTMAALQDFAAELDGMVPSFPTDMLNADLSKRELPPSLLSVDHRVDVRLHVLVRLRLCHDEYNYVAPCSYDGETNKELLESFLASYALLERLYDQNIIHGIGLDGVNPDDIQYLLDNCNVKPQLYRGTVMQALDIYGRHHGREDIHDKHVLGQVLKENNITFLATNAVGTILARKDISPNAYALLQNLGGVLYRAHNAQSSKFTSSQKGDGQYYTVPKLVLSYLVRHKVCVIPHVYKAEHLADDAPEAVAGLAHFLSERRMAEIDAGMRALLSEIDLPEDHGLGMEGEKEVAGVFHNLMVDDVHISQVRDNVSRTSKWEVPGENDGYQVWTVGSRESVVIIAKAGDVFRAYGPNGAQRGTYVMTEEEGGCTDFRIVPPLDYIIEG
jgi:hypothetical protein